MEAIDRIPDIEKRRDTPVLEQPSFQLDAADYEMPPAYYLAIAVLRAERIQLEATHAGVATGEEAHRGRQVFERTLEEGRPDLSTGDQAQPRGQRCDPIPLCQNL